MCSLSKVSGLCPSKRYIKASPIKKGSVNDPATVKVDAEPEANVKIELEPALVEGQVIQSELVKTEEQDTLIEKRHMKEEHNDHVDTSTSLVW